MRTSYLLFALPFAVFGCSSSEPADGGSSEDEGPIKELSYELHPFVHQLDDLTLSALAESDEDGTLTFTASPAGLEGLERGSIVIGASTKAAPSGLLRIVRDVEHSSGSTIVHSVGAYPQLAFKKLYVRASAGIASITDPSTNWEFPNLDPLVAGSAKGAEPIDFYLFDGDGDKSTKNDQVHVFGELGGRHLVRCGHRHRLGRTRLPCGGGRVC